MSFFIWGLYLMNEWIDGESSVNLKWNFGHGYCLNFEQYTSVIVLRFSILQWAQFRDYPKKLLTNGSSFVFSQVQPLQGTVFWMIRRQDHISRALKMFILLIFIDSVSNTLIYQAGTTKGIQCLQIPQGSC